VALADAPLDLPVMVLRDQLSGAVSLVPGPPTYEGLLATRRAGAAMQEQWAGYYVPLVTAGTAPVRLSLKPAGGVNTRNASLAVIAVVWEPNGDGARVGKPRYLGYDSLRSAIDVDLALTAAERAALFAFIYPLTPDASATLPARIEEAVDVQASRP
jgi:hypothetical protein